MGTSTPTYAKTLKGIRNGLQPNRKSFRWKQEGDIKKNSKSLYKCILFLKVIKGDGEEGDRAIPSQRFDSFSSHLSLKFWLMWDAGFCFDLSAKKNLKKKSGDFSIWNGRRAIYKSMGEGHTEILVVYNKREGNDK